MFYRIGDIDPVAVDAGLFQGAVEHLAGGSYKRLAGEVLLVAGLLADQHDLGMLRAFTEHRLGGVLIKVTGTAVAGLLAERRDAVCSGRFSGHGGLVSLLRLARL